MNSRRGTLALLAVLVLGVAAHHGALGHGFVNYDDPNVIVDNPVIEGVRSANVKAVFSEVRDNAYLPFYHAAYWLDWSLFGKDGRGYHAVSLVLHLINAVLIHALLMALFESPRLALIAAALFVVHPVTVESVAWASGRKDVLSLLFLLLGVLTFVRGLQGGGLTRTFILPLIFFTVAMFTKATALVYPAFLVGAVAVLDRRGRLDAERRRAALWPIIWLSLFDLAVTAIHLLVARMAGTVDSADGGGTAQRLIDMLGVFGRYVRLVVFPVGLTVHHDVVFDGRFGGAELNGVGLLLVAAFGVWRFIRTRSALWFGMSWFLVALVPFNNVWPRFSIGMAERYLHIPLIGACIAVGAAADALARRFRPALVTLLVALVAIGAAWSTHGRVAVWRDSESLWRNAIRQAPDAMLPRLQLGHALESRARSESIDVARKTLAEAMRSYESGLALARSPRESVQARLKLSGALVLNGEWTRAMALFGTLDDDVAAGRAPLLKTDRDALSLSRATALVGLLRFDEARVALATVDPLGPHGVDALDSSAAISYIEGRRLIDDPKPSGDRVAGARLIEKSLADYEEIVRRHPDRLRSRVDRIKALAAASWQSDHEITLANEIGRLVKRWPDEPSVRSLRAQINAAVDPEQAVRDLDFALQKDPYRESDYVLLAAVLRQLGRNKDATLVLMSGISKLPQAKGLIEELAGTYLAFAYHHRNTKEPGLALESVERAVGLQPEQIEGWVLMGELHENFALTPGSAADATAETKKRQDHWELARRAFEKALQLDAAVPRGRSGLARYWKAYGWGAAFEATRFDDAADPDHSRRDALHERQLRAYREVVRLEPSAEEGRVVRDWLEQWGRTWRVKASRKLAELDHSGAREDAETALRYDDWNADGWTLRAKIDAASGRMRDSDRAHEKAIELEPDCLESLFELGKSRFAAEDWAHAKDLLDRFLAGVAKLDDREPIEVPVRLATTLRERCVTRLGSPDK